MPPASRGWNALFGRCRYSHYPAPFRQLSTTASRLQLQEAVLPPPPPLSPTSKVTLRPYQEECVQAVLSDLKLGHKRIGLSLATGSGKTVIFTQIAGRIPPRSAAASQTLILAHRQELVEQAYNQCVKAYPSKSVEIDMAKSHASGLADITIASSMSILGRLEKYDPNKFNLVIVDETHHIVSRGYREILSHFGLDTKTTDSPTLIGVSATMSRLDGLSLGVALDHISFHKDYVDMINEGWLSPLSFTTVQSGADVSSIRKSGNDFATVQLSKAVNLERINELTVRSWAAKASDSKSTMVFCVDVAHVRALTKKFIEKGVSAGFVTGTTAKPARNAILQSFKAGELRVLLNCGVFTEGTDVPNIDCVVLGRPTRSKNLIVQMIGRGMRLHPGKTSCHVIDMVANLSNGIVTVPTLFGLDPQEITDKSTVQDLIKLKKQNDILEEREAKLREQETENNLREEEAHTNDPARDELSREQLLWAERERDLGKSAASISVTFTHYDSVFDLLEDTSGEQHIRSISRNAWVCISRDRFILSDRLGRYLRLQKTEDGTGYEITETVQLDRVERRQGKAPFMKPRQIFKAITFTDAVHGADTYASKKYAYSFITRSLSWRDAPATPAQIIFLNKIRPKDSQLTTSMTTKGKAGDMITKLKHGARGQFSAIKSQHKKVEKEQLRDEKDLLMRAREQVTVGPIMN